MSKIVRNKKPVSHRYGEAIRSVLDDAADMTGINTNQLVRDCVRHAVLRHVPTAVKELSLTVARAIAPRIVAGLKDAGKPLPWPRRRPFGKRWDGGLPPVQVSFEPEEKFAIS